MELLSFSSYIGNFYGVIARDNVKLFMKVRSKLSKHIPRRIFLLRCRDAGFFPKFISDTCNGIMQLASNNHSQNKKYINLYDKTCKSLLNIEISSCCTEIMRLKKQSDYLERSLRQSVDYHVIEPFFRSQHSVSQTSLDANSLRLQSKFKSLLSSHMRNIDLFFDENSVVNLSGYDLPIEAVILLSFRPNFNMPCTNHQVPVIDLIADIENVLCDLQQPDERNFLRSECAWSIKNHIKHHKPNKIDKFLFYCFRKTKLFLKNNKDLYIISSDKGNKTVILHKNDYINKLSHLLDDTNTYIRLEADPTKKLINKNNKLIKRLYDDHIINKLQRNQLMCETETSPKIYGLPKLHKEGCPLRPVVSNINTPGYKLGKYISNILTKLVDPDLNIKNSTRLKHLIDNITLPPDDILVSFDVQSLYTNVDINLALDAINRKWNEIEQLTPIDQHMFKEIVKFCASECNYFVFNGTFFTQKFGLAMGNPLSSVLADLSMDLILHSSLNLVSQRPTFIYKYVDDIIASVPEKDINNILTIFNNMHDRITFTIEKETNNSISFLDLRLFRTSDSKIITDWFAKPYSSNRILNYLSSHPHSIKINTAKGLINRIFSLSDHTFHNKNIKLVNDILLKNNYPVHIINKLVKNHLRNHQQHNTEPNTDQRGSCPIISSSSLYKSFTYIHPLSLHVKRKIKHHHINTQLAMKPVNTLRARLFSNLKDLIPSSKKSNIVYKVDCGGCTQSYIGQTSKRLETRLNQHQHYIDKSTPSSALAAHSIETGHSFNFDQSQILMSENNKRKREIKEACHIIKNRNSVVNLRRDMDCIHTAYHLLLHDIA